MATEYIEVMLKDKVISTLEVDYTNKLIKSYETHLTNPSDWIFLPFGHKENPTWHNLQEYFEDRCFPRSRSNVKELLKVWDVDEYDVWKIIHKTHGVMNDDYVWFRFDGEKTTFDEVRMR